MNNKLIWPVAIIIVFSAFVLFFIGYLIFSTSLRVDLVTQDYYAREIDYQRQIDRINRTKPFASTIKITLDKRENAIRIIFPEYFNPGSMAGTIHLFRPSDAGSDRTINLSLNHNREQLFPSGTLAKGNWKVKLNWDYEGQEYFLEKSLMVL